jgi:hypothetical protein
MTVMSQNAFEMPHVVCIDPLTIYEAWDLAVKLAPTEYVLNLNLDDRLFSNSIALMKDFLEASERGPCWGRVAN